MTKLANTFFKPTDIITMSGLEFAVFYTALEEYAKEKQILAKPLIFKFVDSETGDELEADKINPEDINSGKITKVLDMFRTMDPENSIPAINGNLTLNQQEAQRTIYSILKLHQEAGLTHTEEEIKKDYERLSKDK